MEHEFSILFTLSLALFAGLFLSRIVKPLGLPAVTGYLLAGVLIGPYCLGRLGIEGVGFHSMEAVEALNELAESRNMSRSELIEEMLMQQLAALRSQGIV